MFGRVRASSVPAESLERPPSKIFNDNSISVYEATLMKLKLGSRRNPTPCSKEIEAMDESCNSTSIEPEPMKVEVNFASSATSSSHQSLDITLDTDCQSERSSLSSSGCDSVGNVKQPRTAEVSVQYLFSKFKRARDVISWSSSEAMSVDNVGVSPSSSGSGSVNDTEQQWEEEGINSLPDTESDML